MRSQKEIMADYLLVEIKNLLVRNREIQIKHNLPGGNRGADGLSNHEISQPMGMHMLKPFPEGLNEILRPDSTGIWCPVSVWTLGFRFRL